MLRGVWRCRSLICYSTACNPDDRAERAYREQRGSEPSLEWETKSRRRLAQNPERGKEMFVRVCGGEPGNYSVCTAAVLFCTKGGAELRIVEVGLAGLGCGTRSAPDRAPWGVRENLQRTIENKLILRALQRNIKGQSWLTQFSATAVENSAENEEEGEKKITRLTASTSMHNRHVKSDNCPCMLKGSCNGNAA